MSPVVSNHRFCATTNGCYHRTALIKDKVSVPSKGIRLWNPPQEELTNPRRSVRLPTSEYDEEET